MREQGYGGIVAIVLAWCAFMALARWLNTHPSPVDGSGPLSRLFSLFRRDTDTDPAPGRDPKRGKGYRLHDEGNGHTVVDWIDEEMPPPAKPAGRPESPNPRLDRWVAASLDEEAEYGTIVEEGQRLFGVSAPTVKRSLARVRGTRGGAGGG